MFMFALIHREMVAFNTYFRYSLKKMVRNSQSTMEIIIMIVAVSFALYGGLYAYQHMSPEWQNIYLIELLNQQQ